MKRYISSDRKYNKYNILKQQAAWQAKYDARKAEYDEQDLNYERARHNWKLKFVDIIKDQFSSYLQKLPGIEIYINPSLYSGVQVTFKYEDRGEHVALRWEYGISLSESGEIVRSSNSWSGLDLATPDKVQDLLNSANLIKVLSDFTGWESLLSRAKEEKPKSSDYISIRDPRYDPEYQDPGFDKMLRQASTEQLVGQDVWVNYSRQDWAKIISETDKFYKICYLDGWRIRNSRESARQVIEQTVSNAVRVRKDKFSVNPDAKVLTDMEMIEMMENPT